MAKTVRQSQIPKHIILREKVQKGKKFLYPSVLTYNTGKTVDEVRA